MSSQTENNHNTKEMLETIDEIMGVKNHQKPMNEAQFKKQFINVCGDIARQAIKAPDAIEDIIKHLEKNEGQFTTSGKLHSLTMEYNKVCAEKNDS